MNDQQRIETAADNCEVLRARLAKYEDAEGNPKAQPSGVVLPPQCTDRAIPVKYRKGWNCCISEVARLNSSPVSAGVVDERAAFETWYLGHFYMGDKQCGLEWLSTEPCGGYRHQHPGEQWIVWQARAALSAPSHGEQVRGISNKYFIATQGLNRSTGQWETVRGDFYLTDEHHFPAWRDVIAERQRQVSAEGWTPEHDDAHSDGALAKAAACYAANAGYQRIPKTWPWMAKFWKPGTARRMLVKSGALILAEIERLDRASAPSAGSQEHGE